jgi:hypothetical protein
MRKYRGGTLQGELVTAVCAQYMNHSTVGIPECLNSPTTTHDSVASSLAAYEVEEKSFTLKHNCVARITFSRFRTKKATSFGLHFVFKIQNQKSYQLRPPVRRVSSTTARYSFQVFKQSASIKLHPDEPMSQSRKLFHTSSAF